MSDYIFESRPVHSAKPKVIGYGGSSTVLLAEDPKSGKPIAIKRFSIIGFSESTLIREVEILVKLNHPCVLKIHGFLLPQANDPAEIHMEYAPNGSLQSVLRLVRRGENVPLWNSTAIVVVICGIVLGMRYMHSHGFHHRDLKPGNLLLSENWRVLIADFGNGVDEYADATSSVCGGTVCYAAPEMFEEGQQTKKVDVCSFGIILYEILVGRPLFCYGTSPFDVLRWWRQEMIPDIHDGVLPEMRDLILRCMSRNPDKRPSFDEILHTLEDDQFHVVSGADIEEVTAYVQGVLAWESLHETDTRNSIYADQRLLDQPGYKD
jgi:serine/threonine protein kinase